MHTRDVLVVAAALLTLSGCAAILRQEAATTEQLLAEAGFQMRAAALPSRSLNSPPYPLVVATESRCDAGVIASRCDDGSHLCVTHGYRNLGKTIWGGAQWARAGGRRSCADLRNLDDARLHAGRCRLHKG